MARSLNPELDIKRGDLLRVWPEDLVVDPAKRGRFVPPTPAQVEEKASSIAQLGQLQPCPVTITHDKRLELAAGFTRWEAITLLNGRATDPSQKIRIEVKVIDANEEESFLANIAENRMRNVTTVIDDAHNIRKLSERFHKSDGEICDIYRDETGPMSPSWLENMRSLLRLERDHQIAIHNGQLNASVGYLLATMAPAERAPIIEEAKKEGKGGKVTTTAVVKAARKRGALTTQASLRIPEMKSSWKYLSEKDRDPRVRQLGAILLEHQSGKMIEADFFTAVHKLFTGK